MIWVSGGQTGVDRAVLDIGLRMGMTVTGWCPAGRWAEDGPLAPKYPLRPTPASDTAQRTIWNVHLSDALLVLNDGYSSPGTALAVKAAQWLQRPVLRQNVVSSTAAAVEWIRSNNLRVINLAGPRLSEAPDAYAGACDWLERFVMRYRAANASTS